jgi:streptogramin lyase
MRLKARVMGASPPPWPLSERKRHQQAWEGVKYIYPPSFFKTCHPNSYNREMKTMQRKLPVQAFLLSLFALALLVLQPGFTSTSAANGTGLTGNSTPLKENGKVYEINPDQQGDLWVSDLAGQEIRRFKPGTGTYTAYPVAMPVSDARRDSRDLVWWTGFNPTFSNLSLVKNEIRTWQTPDDSLLTSTAVDGNGDVWLNDVTGQRVFQYRLVEEQLCTFTLPGEMGSSDYLLASGEQLWFANRNFPQLVRLDFSQEALDSLTTWQLSIDSYPEGLALDSNGFLWWADEGRGELGRLDPFENRIRSYPLSDGMKPVMIALGASQVWYSEYSPDMSKGRVGVLAPEIAEYTESTQAASIPEIIAADCQSITARTATITPVQGQTEWSQGYYPLDEEVLGRSSYLIPGHDKNGNAYIPWGIAWGDGQVWVAVQSQQALLRLSGEGFAAFLPFVIK